MKKKILTLAVFASALSAAADQNLPNFAGQQPIGRLQAFYSPKGLTWFLPLALSSELSCSPSSGSKRSCILKVFNSYSAQESSGIDQFETANKTKLVALSNLDASIVQNVQEDFADLPTSVQPSVLKMGTLAVNARGPYASAAFRADSATIANIESQYQGAGLGTFSSQVLINMESVGDYLAIDSGDALKTELMKITQSYTRTQLAAKIDAIVRGLSVSSSGLSQDEGRQILVTEIQRRYFVYGWSKTYRPNVSAIAAIGASIVIENERTPPALVRCTATIALRSGAVSNTDCQLVNP